MLWAATCLCFFGLLEGRRADDAGRGPVQPQEPSRAEGCDSGWRHPTKVDLGAHQEVQDGPILKRNHRHGGVLGSNVVPVQALLKYMARRGNEEGPLFRFRNGHPLTRVRLDGALKKALQGAGSTAAGISTHSLRIGAATTAARRGVEDSAIKDLGRWKSRAYLGYIRRTEADRARTTAVLVKLDGN